MKHLLLLAIVMLSSLFMRGQQEIPLYAGSIPNAKDVPDNEIVVDRGGLNGRAFEKTSVPTLTIFSPPHPNGKAIIICPGGGYTKTAFDKEGIWVAQSLLADRITCFVLKYRIPQDEAQVNKSLAPLQDAQAAIRYVRKHAKQYQIHPDQIGIMGFSAGGHLAASATNHYAFQADSLITDQTSAKPNFSILIYPVISFVEPLVHKGSRRHLLGDNPPSKAITFWSMDQQVHTETPPTFLVHAADDRSVSVQNSLAYYSACLTHDVPVEMHLYPAGGHGFALYNTTTLDNWMDRLKNWLKGIK